MARALVLRKNEARVSDSEETRPTKVIGSIESDLIIKYGKLNKTTK